MPQINATFSGPSHGRHIAAPIGSSGTVTFFGDGTRIPMLAVSPFAKKGAVSHSYADHTSIARFIERNWRLPALSSRSWDNLPNPKASAVNPTFPPTAPPWGTPSTSSTSATAGVQLKAQAD